MDTMDISSAVAGGMLRAMEGETHQYYRRALVTALASTEPLSNSLAAEALIETELSSYALMD